MRLQHRLSALEGLKATPTAEGEGQRKLLEYIDTIADRLCGGDLSDNLTASTAERVALAFERGDAAFAEQLLLEAAGRAPE